MGRDDEKPSTQASELISTPSLLETLHAEACVRQREFYLDPATGLMVTTRFGHLTRGSCCGSGCRHCPFDGIKGHSATRDTETKPSRN